MKIVIGVVGKAKAPLAEAIAEYEGRAGRYFDLTVAEVKEGKGKSGGEEAVMESEGDRLLERVPPGYAVVALTRDGKAWSSRHLADRFSDWALHAMPGVAFLIGGAFGLSSAVLERSAHRLSLSAMTMPHELARLVLAEQIYRAGTIQRGEPYHKGD